MKSSQLVVLAVVLGFSSLFSAKLPAQFGGSRSGVEQGQSDGQQGLSNMTAMSSPEVVQGYIIVDGTAELRVAPTSIRIVLAVTSENNSPEACRAEVDTKILALRNGWTALGISPNDVVDDFIAVLPRYQFDLEDQQGVKTAVETKSGYFMQSNLHISVKDDKQSSAAIRVAFANGVSDIIAFDYWNDQIEDLKKQARVSAVESAKEKSDVLLAFFDKRPQLINISESSKVIFPESLYHSFTNSQDENFYSNGNRWQDVAVIRTFRPKNTYYRGYFSNGDRLPKALTMKSEISVVSTVKLYFESPIAQDYLKLKQSVNQ